MKILFFGDIVGRIGRRALAKILPEFKKEFKPDLILANGENLAHGLGATVSTVQNVLRAGIDYLTAGNHFWDKKEIREVVGQKLPIIRPANFPTSRSGNGYVLIKTRFGNLLLINLSGRVFISDLQTKAKLSCPFRKFDRIFSQFKNRAKFIVVDFHAEATAEKVALGYYLDGRVSAVFGTHTHIQTVDEKILAGGTAYLTDLGMVGAKDSVIGVSKELIIEIMTKSRRKSLLQELKLKKLKKSYIPEKGLSIVNAVFSEFDNKSGRAIKIKRISREILIK